MVECPSFALPHRKAHGMCIVNGIRDLVQWRMALDWSNEFVYGLGLGGGFVYLKFKLADPPRQVYWGNGTARQHEYLARLLDAGYTVIEGRSFKFAWDNVCKAVDAGTPPVLGPLDMFYLPYYEGIYQKRHIPIHYVLLVGHDHERVHVLDTDKEVVQTFALDELEKAWNVSVPAMGKRNRLAIFNIPQRTPDVGGLIRKSVADECRTMLRPPVSLVGIPAMKKLAREIVNWPEEMGQKATAASLQQVQQYLNSPPDISGDHLTAGRDLYVTFLEEAGHMTGLDFSTAMGRLRETIRIIPELRSVIQQGNLKEAATQIRLIAETETEAYEDLSRIVRG